MKPTNIFHEQWEYAIHHANRRPCDICGFQSIHLAAYDIPRHEICRLRAEAKQPTPPVNDDPHCACTPCLGTQEHQV